ncbi:Cobalamin biosynthesis protein CobW [Balamuthia mandrillaris]
MQAGKAAAAVPFDAEDEAPPLLEEVLPEEEKQAAESSHDAKKVPVTIITGFLGAGKTTFLKYVLTEKHGKRIAVIQNEFGIETGADRATVFGADGTRSTEYFELPNGCICCSVRGDLVLTLENLMERKQRFDYILIETSGLADPGPLAATFWMDDELESQLYLDGIVTIVDAKHFLRHLEDEKKSEKNEKKVVNEAQRQVAFADRIVLNKKDLLLNEGGEEAAKRLMERIKQHNAYARMIMTERARVDLNDILDIRAFDLDRALEVDPLLAPPSSSSSHKKGTEGGGEESCCGCSSKEGEDEHQHHHHHLHDDTVKTVNVTVEGEADYEKARLWLGDLLWEEDEDHRQQQTEKEEERIRPEIFRVKGVLAIKGDRRKYALQAVHSLFELWPCEDMFWKEAEKRCIKMVFIGRNLDAEELARSLREHTVV